MCGIVTAEESLRGPETLPVYADLPIGFLSVTDHVKINGRALDIVADPVIPDPVPPPTDRNAFQLLTPEGIRLDAGESTKNPALDFFRKSAEITLESLRGNYYELGH